MKMSQDGARPRQFTPDAPDQAASLTAASELSEYSPHLTKADLEHRLSTMYDKLARKFQAELHKSTNTLSQEIVTLGGRTDILEIKHESFTVSYPRKTAVSHPFVYPHSR